ncbi:MAG: hypothetical protein ACYS9T_11500 [Planctomycetota bacterium]|jgi:hypothetical protein
MTSDAKIGLLLGLVFIFTVAFIINGLPRFSSNVDETRQAAMALRRTVVKRIAEVNDANQDERVSWLTRAVERRIVDHVVGQIMQSANTKERMQEAIDKRLSEIDRRVRGIESQFPDETDFSKATLLSNALLATRIDYLSKQVDQIQARVLTRWDVALVVVAIITGVVSLLISAFAILKAIAKPKRRY